MKTKIFQIIVTLAVSLCLSAGVTLAQDKKGKQHKSHGKAYSYQKNLKGNGYHPDWNKKHYKSYRHGHRPDGHYHRHYYHKRHWDHTRWHRNHFKSYQHRLRPKQPYHKRNDRYELHDRHRQPNKRNAHRDGFIFGMSFNDPLMAVLIGAKGN